MDFIIVKSSKQDKEDYVSVYARVRNSKYNKKYAIGFSIKRSEWEIYKSHKYHVDTIIKSLNITYGIFANILEQIKQELEESFDPANVTANIKLLKEAFMETGLPKSVEKYHPISPLLTDFIQDYHDDHVNGNRFKFGTQTPIAKSTLCTIRCCRKLILEYEDFIDQRITLDQVDSDFRNSFVSWLQSKDYQLLTIRNHLAIINTCMKVALSEHVTNNDKFLYDGFVPKKNPIDHIFLTPQQISEMLKFNISNKKELISRINEASLNEKRKEELLNFVTDRQAENIRFTRDIFIVGCLTGQRASDFMRINKDMIRKINNVDFIKLVQEKTKKTIYIPEDHRVKEILKRYKGKLPHIPLCKLNVHIKTIAELMGWTHQPCFDRTIKGKKNGARFCDLISSHTARRSFATNSYAAGVPLKSIMAITGHSSEDSLRTYLHITLKESALLAARDVQKILDM